METARVALGTESGIRHGEAGWAGRACGVAEVLGDLLPALAKGSLGVPTGSEVPMSWGAAAMPPPAKNLVLYRNGDPFFHGRKLVVSPRRILTFEAFLNEATSSIQAAVAVRSIYTPRQGHRVTGLGELRNGGQYVAAGFERFRRLDYLQTGMKEPGGQRQAAGGLQKYPAISRRASVLERWKRQVNVPFVIHVFRNGDLLSPAFRLVLPKSVLQEWSTVLHLLSEKANLRSGAVRKLCKLSGDVVSSAEELRSGHYYVAVGLEKYRSLPYFELLAPKKAAPRPLRNLPANRRRNYGQGVDCRRAQSTGTAEKENRPSSPPARPKQARRHPHRDGGKSVFHAKPICAGPKNLNLQQGSDKGRSVYRTENARREMQGAQEVGEDEDTQVDLPIDQKTAEIVEEEEECVPGIKQLPRQAAATDGHQKTTSVLHPGGDSGDGAGRWAPTPLAQTSSTESATSLGRQSPSEAPPGGERS